MKSKPFFIKTIITATFVALLMPLTHASLSTLALSGSSDDKSNANKFSLKYYNSGSKKSFSLANYRYNLQYKGVVNFNSNGSSFSTIKFNEGNNNYNIPFKYTVKVSKFKTPSPNN